MTIVIKIGKAGMGGTVTCSTPYLIDDARVREILLNDSSLPLLTDAPLLPNTYQKRRVPSAAPDTTVLPSGDTARWRTRE